jgi:hypothetical protein
VLNQPHARSYMFIVNQAYQKFSRRRTERDFPTSHADRPSASPGGARTTSVPGNMRRCVPVYFLSSAPSRAASSGFRPVGRCVGTRRDGDSLDMARSRMRRQQPADERPGPCTGVLAQQRRKHSTGCRQAASPEERRGGWVPVGLVSPGRGGAAAGASWSCTGGNRVDVMRTPS